VVLQRGVRPTYLPVRARRHLRDRQNPILQPTVVIGVEPGYKREQDVYIQTELVAPDVQISNNLNWHAENILEAMNAVRGE
jgi:hypothetical protein